MWQQRSKESQIYGQHIFFILFYFFDKEKFLKKKERKKVHLSFFSILNLKSQHFEKLNSKKKKSCLHLNAETWINESEKEKNLKLDEKYLKTLRSGERDSRKETKTNKIQWLWGWGRSVEGRVGGGERKNRERSLSSMVNPFISYLDSAALFNLRHS